jgi:hypothetical protein
MRQIPLPIERETSSNDWLGDRRLGGGLHAAASIAAAMTGSAPICYNGTASGGDRALLPYPQGADRARAQLLEYPAVGGLPTDTETYQRLPLD